MKKGDKGEGQNRGEEEGVGDVAVVMEIVQRAARESEYVDIRSVGGEDEKQSGVRGNAVQAGMAEEETGEAVSDVVQA